MGMHVIDGEEGLAKRERKPFGGRPPHEERGGEAGAAGGGNGVHSRPGGGIAGEGLGKRPGHDATYLLDMGTGGDFGHHAAIGLVEGHLGIDDG